MKIRSTITKIILSLAMTTPIAGVHTNTNTIQTRASSSEDKARSKVRTWMNKNIKSTMSEDSKIKAITKYVGDTYSYGESTSWVYMVLNGSGDCWASSSLIEEMCEMAGIKAWLRDDNRRVGKASGHRNTIAKTKAGKYYECEAGYTGKAPRTSSCIEISKEDLWESKKASGGGYYLTQYIGESKTLPVNYTMPSTLNGEKVRGTSTNISNSTGSWGPSFWSQVHIKKITIPEGYEKIDHLTFAWMEELEEVTIPSTVKKIEGTAFMGCKKLTKINIAESNPYYTSENGVIYNKQKTEVTSCPASNIEKLPYSVTTIKEYAFQKNSNLKKLKMPSRLKKIENRGFYECDRAIFDFRDCRDVEIEEYGIAYSYVIDRGNITKASKDGVYSSTILSPEGTYIDRLAKENNWEREDYIDIPEKLTVYKDGDKSVIEWTKVKGAKGYKIYLDHELYKTVTNTTKLTIPYTDKEIRITVHSDYMQSFGKVATVIPAPVKPKPAPVKPKPAPVKPKPAPVKPKPAPVKPKPVPAKPSRPSKVYAYLRSDKKTTTVSWTKSKGATSYSIYINSKKVKTVNGSTATANINCKSPSQVSISASNKGGTSAKTKASTAKLVSSKKVTASRPKAGYIKVKWTKVPNASYYKIWIKQTNKGGWKYAGKTSKQSHQFKSPYKKGTPVYISIEGYNSLQYGKPSAVYYKVK